MNSSILILLIIALLGSWRLVPPDGLADSGMGPSPQSHVVAPSGVDLQDATFVVGDSTTSHSLAPLDCLADPGQESVPSVSPVCLSGEFPSDRGDTLLAEVSVGPVPACPVGAVSFQSLQGHVVAPSGVDLQDVAFVEGDPTSHSLAPLESGKPMWRYESFRLPSDTVW